MSGSFMIGFPSWTAPRDSDSLRSVSSFEANATPPMPSRAVSPPARTRWSPAACARFGVSRLFGRNPTQPTFTSGFTTYAGSK